MGARLAGYFAHREGTTMAKRTKQPARRAAKGERHEKNAAFREAALEREATLERAALVAHPPARHLSFLTFSILLFAAWFVFLFVTALLG
jgi:hypothetical protein